MPCSNATIAPFVLPMTNITFSGKRASLRHAVLIEVGEPRQRLYFTPSTMDDAVSVSDLAQCTGADAETICGPDKGGLFRWNESSTYDTVRPSLWNGSHTAEDERIPTLWIHERLSISDRHLDGFPLTQFETGRWYLPNTLGLHERSNFLSIIESSKWAPTQSWGMWVGNPAFNNGTSGALVIGGYDKARIRGNFTRFDRTADDFLARVDVESLEYNSPEGLTTSLLDSSRRKPTVLVTPETPNLDFDPPTFERFVNVTGAVHLDFDTDGWPAGTPLGNLTVKLAGGFQTTIPAYDLWQPWIKPLPDGSQGVVNDSFTVSRIVGRHETSLLKFGLPLLASTYMTFHPDEDYFELAAAHIDPDIESSIEPFCDPALISQDTTAGDTLNVGIVAGGVIGGVAGLALISVLVWLLRWRMRKPRVKEIPKPIITEMATPSDTGSENVMSRNSALVPVELPLTVVRSELPPPSWQRHEMEAGIAEGQQSEHGIQD